MFFLIAFFGCDAPDDKTVPPDKPQDDTRERVTGLKPEPIEIIIRAAHDDERIALRFDWNSLKDYSGQFHDLITYDGREWTRFSGEDRIYEDSISVIFQDTED